MGRGDVCLRTEVSLRRKGLCGQFVAPPEVPKGFTLVELMVVVAIIALLAMIAIPNVARARQNAEDAKTQKELHSIYTATVMFQTQNGRAPTSLTELQPYITINETKYEWNPN